MFSKLRKPVSYARCGPTATLFNTRTVSSDRWAKAAFLWHNAPTKRKKKEKERKKTVLSTRLSIVYSALGDGAPDTQKNTRSTLAKCSVQMEANSKKKRKIMAPPWANMLLACASVKTNLMVMQHFVHFEREREGDTQKEKERMHCRCCILLQNQNGTLPSPSFPCAHFLSFLIFWTPAPHARERVRKSEWNCCRWIQHRLPSFLSMSSLNGVL